MLDILERKDALQLKSVTKDSEDLNKAAVKVATFAALACRIEVYDTMNTTFTIMAVVIVLAFVGAVTVAYPTLEAQASNSISDSRNKGIQLAGESVMVVVVAAVDPAALRYDKIVPFYFLVHQHNFNTILHH